MAKAWGSSCRGFHDGQGSNPELVTFFPFLHTFLPSPFHNSFFFFFLYTGFSDHLLSFLPHFKNIYCSVHTENLLFSDIGIDIGIGNFVANISVMVYWKISISVHLYIPLSRSSPTVPGPSSANLLWKTETDPVNSFTCSQVIYITEEVM